MNAAATSPAEIDFAYIMKRYERAYVRIFATKLGAEIREAEAFGARARTLDALYGNLQFSDFAEGYTALAGVSGDKELLAYRKVRTSSIGVAYATAKMKEVDAELPEFGPLPFNLAVERRLGREASLVNGNDFDRLLWRLYRIFCEPERLENTPLQSRQLILLRGLNVLADALPQAEQRRWQEAGWPRLSSDTISSMALNKRPNVFLQRAWAQL